MRQHALAIRRLERRKEQGQDALFDITNVPADNYRDNIQPSSVYEPQPPREPFRLSAT